MTLSSFKKRSKYLIFLSLLLVYGIVSFQLGKWESFPKLDKLLKVKGVSAQKLKSPVESPAPYSDVQSTSVISGYVKQCANTAASFEVSYPKDWFTTYDGEELKCTYFAPYSFTIPKSTDNFATPIHIEIADPENWQSILKFYENPNDFQNVISVKNVEINGEAVEKIEAMTTGDGLLAKNLRKVSYLSFHSRLPLVFTYAQSDTGEKPAEYEKILEDMVRTLKRF